MGRIAVQIEQLIAAQVLGRFSGLAAVVGAVFSNTVEHRRLGVGVIRDFAAVRGERVHRNRRQIIRDQIGQLRWSAAMIEFIEPDGQRGGRHAAEGEVGELNTRGAGQRKSRQRVRPTHEKRDQAAGSRWVVLRPRGRQQPLRRRVCQIGLQCGDTQRAEFPSRFQGESAGRDLPSREAPIDWTDAWVLEGVQLQQTLTKHAASPGTGDRVLVAEVRDERRDLRALRRASGRVALVVRADAQRMTERLNAPRDKAINT
ncbi:MAG: hypothetical protein KA383_17775 [Phycisphaerae bacterium]|nr:hypothetical protein [Phycisphaerae bacterium]